MFETRFAAGLHEALDLVGVPGERYIERIRIGMPMLVREAAHAHARRMAVPFVRHYIDVHGRAKLARQLRRDTRCEFFLEPTKGFDAHSRNTPRRVGCG